MFTFETQQGEGHGYLAVPTAGSGPGVLVLHAWWGLTPFFTGLCDRLAKEGFVALAPDLHNGQTAATVAEAEALMQQRDSERTEAIAAAAVDQLRGHPAVTGQAIGTIGFSMGAAWAVALASIRPDAVAAVVDFYGTAEA